MAQSAKLNFLKLLKQEYLQMDAFPVVQPTASKHSMNVEANKTAIIFRE